MTAKFYYCRCSIALFVCHKSKVTISRTQTLIGSSFQSLKDIFFSKPNKKIYSLKIFVGSLYLCLSESFRIVQFELVQI